MTGQGSQALFTPIRRRLVAWAMLILGSILVLLGASVYVTMSRSLMDQVDRNLVGHGPGRPPDHDGYRGGVFTLAFGADGRVLANPQQVQVAGVFVQRAPDGGTLVIGQSLEPEEAASRSSWPMPRTSCARR